MAVSHRIAKEKRKSYNVNLDTNIALSSKIQLNNLTNKNCSHFGKDIQNSVKTDSTRTQRIIQSTYKNSSKLKPYEEFHISAQPQRKENDSKNYSNKLNTSALKKANISERNNIISNAIESKINEAIKIHINSIYDEIEKLKKEMNKPLKLHPYLYHQKIIILILE